MALSAIAIEVDYWSNAPRIIDRGCRRSSPYMLTNFLVISCLVLSCWTTLLKTIVKYYSYWIVCTWNMLLSLRMGERVNVLWSVAAHNTIIFHTTRFVVITSSDWVRKLDMYIVSMQILGADNLLSSCDTHSELNNTAFGWNGFRSHLFPQIGCQSIPVLCATRSNTDDHY